jgi:hypothetical protein
MLEALHADKKIRRLEGIGCTPVAIHATREDLLRRIGKALAEGNLRFPDKNGPVLWPSYTMPQLLAGSLTEAVEAA